MPDRYTLVAKIQSLPKRRIAATVKLLEENGPSLPFPFSSGINGSRHERMRKLRVQSRGTALRIF